MENIGKKLKTLAGVLCGIIIVASLIMAIVCWATLYGLAGIGFVVLIGGVLLGIIILFLFYGFGELIEQTTAIRNQIDKQVASKSTETNQKSESDSESNENNLTGKTVPELVKLLEEKKITMEEYRKAIEEMYK